MVKSLRAQGWKVIDIMRQAGISRGLADKWLRLEECPPRAKRTSRPGMAEDFREELWARWEQGQQEGKQLFAEIRERGYVGSYASLMRFLAPWRSARGAGSMNSQPSEAIHPGAVRHISPRTAVALLSKPKPELDDKQSEMVAILKRRCPGFATMRHLVLSFRSILRGGSVSSLRRWAAKAEASGIEVIVRFVRQLKKDWNAVENAVEQGLEQRSDGRSHQPLEDPQERNVWTCRGRTAAGPPLASGVLTKTAPNLDQNQYCGTLSRT